MSAVSSFETESSRKLIPVGLIKPMLLLIVLRSVTKSVAHCNGLSYLHSSVCQCVECSGVTYIDLCFERDCHLRTCDLSCSILFRDLLICASSHFKLLDFILLWLLAYSI